MLPATTTAKPVSVPFRCQPVPFISIVVPVRNEAQHLAKTLGQLLAQDYDPARFEVLVADGRSTDATRDVVRELQAEHANLYLLDNPQQLSSAGRNRAIEAARGEFIVIVDGHCELPGEYYLHDLAAAFARSGAASIGRPQPLDVTGATATQRAIAVARASWLGHNPSSHIYSRREEFVRPDSVAVAYRREVFDAVGLFDESFDACEDVEFNHRMAAAGFDCYFAPLTCVRYHPRQTLGGLYRQMLRYGRGRIRLYRKHRETLTAACLVPAAWVAGTACAAILALMLPLLRWPLVGCIGIYGLVLLGVSLQLARQARDWSLLLRLPAVFTCIHGGAGVGVLMEAIRGRRAASAFSAGTVRLSCPSGSAAQPSRSEQTADGRQGPVLNALTFDVEDYFHVANFDELIPRTQWESVEPRVEASTHKILDALDRANTQATFFVLGWVAERHPNLVRDIQAAGHEIGCHGYWHRLIYRQTPAEFREDLCRARDVLQDITGERVTAYRAPCFSITQRSLWALDVLVEEGFQIDSSIFPTRHDRYGIPGARLEPHRLNLAAGDLWEFPLPVRRLCGFPLPVGGGGYFRLYPYRFTRHALGRINDGGRPFVTYLHPWEFDPEQPRLAPGRLRAARHYVNLARTEPRLKSLLGDFRFGTLTQALEQFASTQPQAAPLARAA